MLSQGTVLRGRYSIERVRATGTTGTVYLAADLVVPRPLAVKEVPAADPVARARAGECFRREAELLASLDHPGLVRVSDFFEERDCWYLVMSFVSGKSLAEVLDERTAPLPVEHVLEWLDQICDVLEYLHGRDPAIVLNDLKPAHVMLDDGQHIRLVDFGAARVLRDDATRDSPEDSPFVPADALLGQAPDVRGLGAIAYALLTGAPPPSAIDRAANPRIASLATIRPDIPPALAEAVGHMLELDAGRRVPSIAKARTMLTRARTSKGTHGLPARVEVRPPRTRSLLLRIGAVAVVALLLGLQANPPSPPSVVLEPPSASASPGMRATTPSPPHTPPLLPSPTATAATPDIPLRLPGPPSRPALPGELRAMRSRAISRPTAAGWRALADAAAERGFYAEASAAYLHAAAVYRRVGDGAAERVAEQKGAQYRSDVGLFVHRTAVERDYTDNYTGARLEPRLGCYVGAFIDRDDTIPHMRLEDHEYGDIPAFSARVGKPHASHFMYRSYGQPFPRAWVEYVRSQGAIPHIAWEPRELGQVLDDAYLRDWVQQAREVDWPIFVRFASEMNGDWTPYHGDPAAYRAAFRRVYQAFRAAPKAALIWCPNTMPENGMDAYYPGDDATDWVGVNFYSVLFLDGNRSRPGDEIHPTDLLDHVYRTYSARKPIAIAEYAATHFALVEGKVRADFAVDKIGQLYASLPTKYPRVKLVDWYDCDNVRHAQPGRQLNNFLLTDVPEVLEAYSTAVQSPWFLGSADVVAGHGARQVVAPLNDGDRVEGASAVQAWVRTYEARPRVYFKIDGRLAYATKRPDRCTLPTRGLAAGRHKIEVLVYDSQGRFVDSRSAKFRI